MNAIQALSQLSYTPRSFPFGTFKSIAGDPPFVNSFFRFLKKTLFVPLAVLHQRLHHGVVGLLRGGQEAVLQHLGHVLPDGHELQAHDIACVVIQGHFHGVGAVGPLFHPRAHLAFAAELAVAYLQPPVALQADGVGQATLADLAVAPALVGDGVEAVLGEGEVFRLHQVVHTG